MANRKVHLRDSHEALLLFGQHDQNLRALEKTYGVQIFGRGHVLSVRGSPGKVEKAMLAIDEMRQSLGKESHNGETAVPAQSDMNTDATYTSALGKAVRPKTAAQKAY